MTGYRDNFLLNKNLAANRTMFTFGKTGFGTGRCDSFINNFGVAESSDNFLCYDNFTANRAVFAFGKTGFGAGGFNRFVSYFSMSESSDNFLCYDNFTADRAMFTFGKTGFGTCGFNRFVYYFGMVCNRDIGDSFFRFTCPVFCKFRGIFSLAFFGAGRFFYDFGGYGNRICSLCMAVVIKTFTACNAGFGSVPGVGYCAPFMSGCRDNFLFNEDLAADRAMFTFGKTGVFTIRFNSFINNFAVAKSFAFGFAAKFAGLGFGAGCVFPTVVAFYDNFAGIAEFAAGCGNGNITFFNSGYKSVFINGCDAVVRRSPDNGFIGGCVFGRNNSGELEFFAFENLVVCNFKDFNSGYRNDNGSGDNNVFDISFIKNNCYIFFCCISKNEICSDFFFKGYSRFTISNYFKISSKQFSVFGTVCRSSNSDYSSFIIYYDGSGKSGINYHCLFVFIPYFCKTVKFNNGFIPVQRKFN